MSYPEGKLLSQDVTANAVRLRSSRLCVFYDDPAREACNRDKHDNHITFQWFYYLVLYIKIDFIQLSFQIQCAYRLFPIVCDVT